MEYARVSVRFEECKLQSVFTHPLRHQRAPRRSGDRRTHPGAPRGRDIWSSCRIRSDTLYQVGGGIGMRGDKSRRMRSDPIRLRTFVCDTQLLYMGPYQLIIFDRNLEWALEPRHTACLKVPEGSRDRIAQSAIVRITSYVDTKSQHLWIQIYTRRYYTYLRIAA